MSEIVNVKPVQSRYITIDELTFQNLTGNELKIYMALRFESDYSKKCSTVELTIDSLTILAKVSRSKVFEALNSLENTHFLIQRTNYKSFKYGKINSYLVARDYKYFKQNDKEFITPPDSSTGGQSYYTRPDSGCISPENGIPIDHNLSLINNITNTSKIHFSEYKNVENNLDPQMTKKAEYKKCAIHNERSRAVFNELWLNLDVTIEEAYDVCQEWWDLQNGIANWSAFVRFLKNPKSREAFEPVSKSTNSTAIKETEEERQKRYQKERKDSGFK